MPQTKTILASLLLPALLLPVLFGCSTAPAVSNADKAPQSADSQSTETTTSADATAEETSGTTTSDPVETDIALPAGLRNRPSPENGDAANSTSSDPFQASLEGTDIYCFGQKVGQLLEDGRVRMLLGTNNISFLPPDPGFQSKQLFCHPASWQEDDNYSYGNFSYLGLEISTQIHSPYEIYRPILTAEENNGITYKCDSPLASYNEDPANDTKQHPIPFLDCQTNGLNLLTQYEFNAISGSPVMVTGGEYGENWKKIFIKRAGDLNYFFIGKISRSINDYWFVGDEIGQFRKKTSEESLNRLLENPENSKLISDWQEIVKSFQLDS